MTKSIKVILAGLLAVPMLALGVVATQPVFADTAVPATVTDCGIKCGANDSKGNGQTNDLFGSGGLFTKITNAALYLIGAISVLMLIYGGIRYTISGGDSTAVTNAKNTIMYAVIGIVVAILAYAIVNFVLGAL